MVLHDADITVVFGINFHFLECRGLVLKLRLEICLVKYDSKHQFFYPKAFLE